MLNAQGHGIGLNRAYQVIKVFGPFPHQPSWHAAGEEARLPLKVKDTSDSMSESWPLTSQLSALDAMGLKAATGLWSSGGSGRRGCTKSCGPTMLARSAEPDCRLSGGRGYLQQRALDVTCKEQRTGHIWLEHP